MTKMWDGKWPENVQVFTKTVYIQKQQRKDIFLRKNLDFDNGN